MSRKAWIIGATITALVWSASSAFADNASISRDLIGAIMNNNLGYLQEFSSGNPGVLHEIGSSLLAPAAEVGNANIVTFLVDHGANVNYSDSAGETPLQIASEWCDYNLIGVLLRDGANVNASDSQGTNPWMILSSIVGVLQMRGMAEAQKTRNGVTRVISLQGCRRALSVVVRAGGSAP